MKKKNIILLFIVFFVVIICILAVVIGFGLSDRKKDDDNKKNQVNLSQEEPDKESDEESDEKTSETDETTKDETGESDEQETTTEELTTEEETTTVQEITTEETTSEEDAVDETTSSVETPKETETVIVKDDITRYSYEYMMIDGQSVYKEYNAKLVELYNCINAQRVKNGLPQLVFDEEISYIACARASQLAYENVMESNQTVKYYDLMKQSGISFSKAAENTAAGHESAKEVVSGDITSWKTSQKHYDNIISVNYTRVGVGVDYSDTMGYVWVAIFSN